MLALVRHAAFWLPFALCTFLAFAPSTDILPPRITDTVAHAAAFIYLTAALWHVYYPTTGWQRPVLWMALYGAGIECVQALLPARHFEVKDMAVDAAGITIAVIGYGALRAWWPRMVGRTDLERG